MTTFIIIFYFLCFAAIIRADLIYPLGVLISSAIKRTYALTRAYIRKAFISLKVFKRVIL